MSSDPANDVLVDEELNDELNELREDDAETATERRDDDPVTEAQHDDDATPVDDTVTEQPASVPRTRHHHHQWRSQRGVSGFNPHRKM